MFTFERRAPCKAYNTPIAHFEQDGKKKIVYYTECKCPEPQAGGFRLFKELHINPLEGQLFTPIPFFSKNQRITISISGFSGSGKSRYCNKLVEEIIELNKKKYLEMDLERILLITSAQESDPAYEDLGKIRLDIQHAIKSGVDINAFANSLLIFDDYTNQPTKEMDNWVGSLKKQLLERSRKLKTHLIFCSHQQRNGFKTSLLNIESQSFVLFYQSNRNESAKLLQHYLDFNKKDIEKLLSIDNGRFSTAYVNRNPRYVITNHYLYSY